MKNCVLCNQPTEGSIGRAGYYWKSLCQTCKDSEDAALELQIKTQSKAFKFVFDKIFGLGEPGSGESAGQAPVNKAVQPKSLEVDTLRKEEKMEQFYNEHENKNI